MQAGLLRVLQEGSVRPVGGAKEEKVDVRIVAATNRDLSQMVAEGSFREDLYYRLHVIEVKIPALRERLDDLPALIDHFLSLFSARYRRERKSVDRDALRRLTTYDWPGNVRQLENVLLNAWLMGEGNELVIEDFELPEAVLGRGGASAGALGGGAAAGAGAGVASGPASARHDRTAGGPPSRGGSVSETLPKARTKAEFKDTERERILGALAACNWNRVQAARMIGVPRRTFYRRLKEFGIL
jgi:DNA-binding NtrC family response regulator